MTAHWRAHVPSIITVAAVVGLLVYGPIPQLPNYHAFADRRDVFGVPHWGDVISNVGFAFVGIWGLRVLLASRRIDSGRAGRLAYGLFFLSLVLYVVAKIAELNDHAIYAQLGIISGHTIKHLLATMSSAILVVQLAWRERLPVAETPGMTPAPINS